MTGREFGGIGLNFCCWAFRKLREGLELSLDEFGVEVTGTILFPRDLVVAALLLFDFRVEDGGFLLAQETSEMAESLVVTFRS